MVKIKDLLKNISCLMLNLSINSLRGYVNVALNCIINWYHAFNSDESWISKKKKHENYGSINAW